MAEPARQTVPARREPPVTQAAGMPYLRFLRRMHLHLEPEWYLEIGTETGKSLLRCPGKAVAVDPEFRLKHDVVAGREALFLYQGTSDAFFASGLAERVAGRFDLAFLDGMHLIEFLLRDFINAEWRASPDGVIAIHDVVPVSHLAAERHWDRDETARWTGDVWKIVPILRRYRPDLTVEVADCAPTGLALVSGLDPENRVLDAHYDEIVAEWRDLSLAEYGEDALEADLALVPARDPALGKFIGTGAPAAPSLAGARRIALKIQAPDEARGRLWGEWHLAQGLARALGRRGAEAEVVTRSAWSGAEADVDLLLWGVRQDYEMPADRPTILWLLYGAQAFDRAGMERAEHVLVASHRMARRLGRALGTDRVSPLLQGFDAERMGPDGPAVKGGALYVANAVKAGLRTTPRLALEQGVEIEIHGLNWEGSEAERFLAGGYVENEALAERYRGAGAVLNDHRNAMGRQGFVSNRILDALACGAPVVSDPVSDLPAELAPWVGIYEDEARFAETVAAALGEPGTRRAERREFARSMAEAWSLDAAAGRVMELLE